MRADRPCALCGGDLEIVTREHPGYVVGGGPYAIAHCISCGSACALTDEDPRPIYDRIYAAPARVPGYSRYVAYADLVASASDPLTELAAAEDMYWAVAEVARQRGWLQGGALLDVGAGLGYLTAALARAGAQVMGLDVSANATARATARFGSRFETGELAQVAASGRRFAGVLLLEMLEHVAAPMQVLEEAWAMVAPGGALLLTTPNKSAWAPNVWWHTDPPPVHLWWFTEDGVAAAARRLGATVQFVDFSRYDAGLRGVERAPRTGTVTVAPVLKADGSANIPPWTPSAAQRTRVRLLQAAARLGVMPGYQVWRGARRPTMAAVLVRPTDPATATRP